MGARNEETRERRLRIQEHVARGGIALVTDLCREFDVSEVTIRTDLRILEQEGKVQRIRGGAVQPPKTRAISYPAERLADHVEEKEAIARAASELVHDGDVIFLDTGTTSLQLTKELRHKVGIILVTADIAIASHASLNLPHATTILLGGKMWPGKLYLTGPLAKRRLSSTYADKAFICVNGIATDGSCSVSHRSSIEVKRMLMEHANERYLIADSSKFCREAAHEFARLNEFDAWITDWALQGEFEDDAAKIISVLQPNGCPSHKPERHEG